ncbi:hypothetical protein [Actinomadura sp. BRA 177]|uniref:hypothetical protein n=1 Tax=Actinomadura sp. BRA 177 TaxID=2745202 RepID=UPI0015962144|nr:hypothetical protein [Actinomadura sp. BRA 177]NVI90725.1 hypothetical protein [Actinomadura sp. BRA 177]
MEKWRLTYVVNDGSGMFGLEPAREHAYEVELDTASLRREGPDEQTILEMMRSAVRDHAGEGAVLTDAEEISS